MWISKEVLSFTHFDEYIKIKTFLKSFNGT